MPGCVAVGCSNRSPRDTERGITFHRVPAGNETLKKEWLVKIKCNLPKLSCCIVCSNHFEPNCFQVNYRHEFLGGSSRRGRLKETAVPTIFCHKKTKEKRQTSETRRQKAERHEFFAYCFQWPTKIIKESLQCSLSFTSSYSTQKTVSIALFRPICTIATLAPFSIPNTIFLC